MQRAKAWIRQCITDRKRNLTDAGKIPKYMRKSGAGTSLIFSRPKYPRAS